MNNDTFNSRIYFYSDLNLVSSEPGFLFYSGISLMLSNTTSGI